MRGMMFARKFSTTKTAALLDRIDEHILLNKSTDAGLYWPGFFEVDTTTPGKQWVKAYRQNQSIKAAAEKARRTKVAVSTMAKLESSRTSSGDVMV